MSARLTAMAPGRFGASINQGPMRRRSHGRVLRLYDLAANAIGTLRHARAIPPDQLLRRVFEQARDYDDAKRMLETTPVARPVIYTLAGCRPGERCVIERTENGFNTRTDDHGAANDWLDSTPLWEGRIGASKVFTCSFEEAAQYSRRRREGLALWRGSFARDSFGWVAPPVLNPYTRIAVEMNARRAALIRAVGYELAARGAHGTRCRPVTASRANLSVEIRSATPRTDAGRPPRPASRPASRPPPCACDASPLASAALIRSISSSADSREISMATRSRPPSASQTKSTHSAWSSCAS